uniref:SAP domain-containing protein n=1 Tax=viral metagenome TaxID=1070528 RepID=A0A6C0E4U0_9ZZZZ
MNAYMESISDKYEHLVVCRPSKSHDDSYLPDVSNYLQLLTTKVNISNLKLYLKHYSLKTTGKKDDLLKRIFLFLYLSSHAISMQKLFRGYLQRYFNRLHGPAYMKRSLCVNDTDFFTLDPLNEIDKHQFISFKDKDNFVYGFDICSLYKLLTSTTGKAINPYNRNKISGIVLVRIKQIIRLGKIFNVNVNVKIEEDIVDKNKSIQFKALDIFQKIDALGNYSDPRWFLSLNHAQLTKFVRELVDIYNYRANLTQETKQKIYPLHGDIFDGFDMNHIIGLEIDKTRDYILNLIERFIVCGIDNDSKSLGAYYVLASLTLVNSAAAEAIPWLYQSVLYI